MEILCETSHPSTRPDPKPTPRLRQLYNQCVRDGRYSQAVKLMACGQPAGGWFVPFGWDRSRTDEGQTEPVGPGADDSPDLPPPKRQAFSPPLNLGSVKKQNQHHVIRSASDPHLFPPLTGRLDSNHAGELAVRSLPWPQ